MGKELQRMLMWVILGTSVFMLWDNWQVYQGKESFFGQPPAAQQQAAEGAKAIKSDVLEAASKASSIEIKDPVVVKTDLMDVTFDRLGAGIVNNTLLKFPRQAPWHDVGLVGMVLGKEAPKNLGDIHLLEVTPERDYVAQSGLVGQFPNHTDMFKLVSSDLTMGDKDTLDVVFEAEKDGLKVTKTYQFKRNDYAITLKTTVTNVSDKSISPSAYYQITRDDGDPEGSSSLYSTFTGPAVYSAEEKFQKIKFADIKDNSAKFQKEANNGWIGMVQHHFVTAWVPPEGAQRLNYVRDIAPIAAGHNLYTVGTLIPLGELQPGQSVTEDAVLYSGPQEQDRLKAIAPGLELVVDYGWLTFLAKPIYWILNAIYNVVGNWGWSIVILTIIVKAILYPIAAKGYRSMARMREVQPRMKAIQEKYGDDKQRLQQAMLELYKNEKINPVGGCLPIFLQIPVFLALYWVLQGSVELRGAPFMLWVQDLAVPDPWFILPALMAITMFLQIYLNPRPTDPVQARVMFIMPVVFSVMFFVFASGLVLYWLTNNILSIIQQWWINKQIHEERLRRQEG